MVIDVTPGPYGRTRGRLLGHRDLFVAGAIVAPLYLPPVVEQRESTIREAGRLIGQARAGNYRRRLVPQRQNVGTVGRPTRLVARRQSYGHLRSVTGAKLAYRGGLRYSNIRSRRTIIGYGCLPGKVRNGVLAGGVKRYVTVLRAGDRRVGPVGNYYRESASRLVTVLIRSRKLYRVCPQRQRFADRRLLGSLDDGPRGEAIVFAPGPNWRSPPAALRSSGSPPRIGCPGR